MANGATLRGLAVLSLAVGFFASTGCSSTGRVFASPDEAMKTIVEVTGKRDEKKVEEIFGKGATDVVWSGDPVADHENALRVKEMILQGVEFQPNGDDAVIAFIGESRWPFPIPIVRSCGGWRFDLEAGREELLSRRIGANELFTIETLHAYVDAQREYASESRDGRPAAYAQRVISTQGKHDGLFWKTADGEPPSPLGPFVAEAATEGYSQANQGRAPFHGYYYRILTGQGANAPGGRKSYLDMSGSMTGGFAAIAWPATYGNSGIMTFVVNQLGVVYQKDLGEITPELAAGVTLFDPEATWAPCPD